MTLGDGKGECSKCSYTRPLSSHTGSERTRSFFLLYESPVITEVDLPGFFQHDCVDHFVFLLHAHLYPQLYPSIYFCLYFLYILVSYYGIGVRPPMETLIIWQAM